MASPLRGGSSTVEGPDNFIVVLSVSSVVSLELFGVVLLFSASLYLALGVCCDGVGCAFISACSVMIAFYIKRKKTFFCYKIGKLCKISTPNGRIG